jgi:AraC-like DNA-binding protein
MPSATPPFQVESLGAEQRVSFRVADSWCRTSTMELRGGVRLGVTALQLEQSYAFSAVQPAAELELVVSRGASLEARALDGNVFERGGNTLQLARTRRAFPLEIRPRSEAMLECVSVSLSERRLRDLLGVAELPSPFRRVSDGKQGAPLLSEAMTPRLLRLLDELVNADVNGKSRLLWHEAKCLELLALMTDELTESARASEPRLSPRDVERLEGVRTVLLARLAEPPSLAELARRAGFSETKLKCGFRSLFGTSVFAYLRQARLAEARRLLLGRGLNVTEVAQRVGYENPSKFAAAFRRQFGLSPSSL